MSGPSRKVLKTSFRPSPQSIRPIYTGGPVLITQDGRWLISTLAEEVQITEIESGLAVARVKGDTTAITSLAISYHTSPPTLITCHQSQILRYYPLPDSAPLSPNKIPSLSYTRQVPKAHSGPILVSATSEDSTLLATGSSDGVVKVWDLAGAYITHVFRGHGGPVSALRFNLAEGRKELFTGSTDGRVRVFDLEDAAARSAKGEAVKPRAVLEGHVSVVRGIDVSQDGKWALTAGRDKVVLVWDLTGSTETTTSGSKGKGKASKSAGQGVPRLIQTMITGEQIEAVGLLPVNVQVLGQDSGRLRCWTAGEKGVLRVWDVFKAEEIGAMDTVEGVDEAEIEDDEQRGIISAMYINSAQLLVAVHADQNIIFHSVVSGQTTRQIIGFNDEIIDATYLTHPSGSASSGSSSSPHSHLALATNSNLVRLYSTSNFSARLLSGHKDMVLCLDKSHDYRLLASGSKDRTARIWAPSGDGAGVEGSWGCVAVCEGHADPIGAVAFSKKVDANRSARFVVTASQDRTVKLWDLSSLPAASAATTSNSLIAPVKARSLATLRAHEKDINSLDISPNDRYLASGSQDKLVKIYAIEYDDAAPGSSEGGRGGLKLLGTCKGHRRGVWTVKFSRTDRVIASGAADRTVRLWSLDDYTCLKTFEGHTNAVLRVDFLSSGMQLVTSASDGLVKLWNIRDESCVKTLDNHEDKIWALAISSDESTIVSAGADSIATFWEDSTVVEQEEKNQALIANVQSEQDFTNYLSLKNYRKAILLALSMSQPGRLLTLFRTIATNPAPGSHCGSLEVDRVLATLPALDLVRLLKMVRDWNANARTSAIAQGVLSAILRLRTAEDLVNAFEKASKIAGYVNGGEEEDGSEEINGEEGANGHGEEKDGDSERDLKRRKKGEAVPGFMELMDGLIPYSERHFTRLDKLVQESYMLDYIVGEMDGGVLGTEVLDI